MPLNEKFADGYYIHCYRFALTTLWAAVYLNFLFYLLPYPIFMECFIFMKSNLINC